MKKYLLFLLFLLGYNQLSEACTCDGPYDYESKANLKEYSFIALVYVDSIYNSGREQIPSPDMFYLADITIKELFKGDPIGQVLIDGANSSINEMWTSCDLGVDPGETWFLFAYVTKSGHQRVNYCTHSSQYASDQGEKKWKHTTSDEKLSKLRTIYEKSQPAFSYSDGLNQTFYPDGALEVAQYFLNNQPHGSKKVYYPDGTLMVSEYYLDGQRSGESIWYDRGGRVERKWQYRNGHDADTCYYYYARTSTIKHQRIFGRGGNMLSNIHYDSEGVMRDSSGIDYAAKEYINKSFYPSGVLHYISVSRAETYQSLRTTQYYESGKLEGKWIHYPDDSSRDFQSWRWSEEGELIRHKMYMTDRSEVDLLKPKKN